MTMKLSTATRNKLLDGGTSGGIKAAFNLCKINIYSGSQPTDADQAATGTLLGTVVVNTSTGLTFDASAGGVISKAAAETWHFTGVAAGIAGWFRMWAAGGTPANASTTEARIDGACGNSGADINLSNISIEVGQVNTCDGFTFTMPGS